VEIRLRNFHAQGSGLPQRSRGLLPMRAVVNIARLIATPAM
jgi:hypothetical protein